MSDAAHVTYFSKSQTRCPICDTALVREELRTGRGRLIAGTLSDELRRNYEPSKKYGQVSPLLYPVTVCPACFYAAYERDFLELPEDQKANVDRNTDMRVSSFRSIVPVVDFNGPRGLREGLASYYFAMMCYEFFPKEFAPTFKQGVSALRGAWVASDLHAAEQGENWDYVARLLYRKARFFYGQAVEREQSGAESVSTIPHLGPDLDKNYGYDGVLYITGLLEYKYGPRGDPNKRRLALERAKRTVSRLFGMGKASKSKPSALLDIARDLYAQIAEGLGEESREGADGAP